MHLSKLAGGLILFAAFAGMIRAEDVSPRTRESFNKDWSFDRFGPMPDGSKRPEPGDKSAGKSKSGAADNWAIAVTASTEESDRDNVAANAFDGNPKTRWCAESSNPGQWLQLDFPKPQALGGIEVGWEFPEKEYGFTVETSADGKTWKPQAAGTSKSLEKQIKLSGTATSLRVVTVKLPAGNWASIAEIRLFDPEGKPIRNTKLEKPKAPESAGKPDPAQTTRTPEMTAYDDAAWRKLDVPHDWGIEGPFRQELSGNTGKLPWKGIGWYRKHFTVPAEDKGKRVFVDFDGAMANSKVWLNGEYAGGWPYGYNSFRVELTPFVKFGADNVIAVRLDTNLWGSRWYPGAGIYRNVWLVKTQPVHVGQWGVWAITPHVSAERGDAKLVVTVDNQSAQDASVSAQAEVYELDKDAKPGKKAATSPSTELKIAANTSGSLELALSVTHPKLWDIDTPVRYLARVIVSAGGKVVDSYDQPFGFRTIEFTPRDGFKLNGRRVNLNGTCNHHDLGILGSAVNWRATERQLEILKEMGCNALRTSHNPPSPEWLELADRMGFVVMDEAFDCWKSGKTGNDYSLIFSEWHKKDLEAMVRRDRNHPCVVLWSIGNEIREQNNGEMAGMLRDIVRATDPTRPVTAGCNNSAAAINGFQHGVDVGGINYNLGMYPKALSFAGIDKIATNEKKPFLSSESSSCVSSRGEYFFPVKKGADSRVNFQVSSYDVDAPGWAYPPDDQFAALEKNPAIMGEFVWTGFDYIGEPTPYNSDTTNLLNFSNPEQKAAMQKELTALGKMKVPSGISYFGIVDLCGFKKDRFFSYQAHWRPDLPMAHIFPHWNWPERAGQQTPVHVYTSGDEAELFLNGKSLGRKKKEQYEYRLKWDDVVYEPGELKVVAYKAGKEWAKDTVKTTGPAAQILLSADRPVIAADGVDLSFVTVTIADKDGLLVPRSKMLVKFEISGPGEISAVGNGDAASHEPFQARERKAFNGLCLAIIRAKSGQSGAIKLKAASEGLKSAEITLKAK